MAATESAPRPSGVPKHIPNYDRIAYLVGDATESLPPNGVLVHSCNITTGWGAGIAATIAKDFGEAKRSYDQHRRQFINTGKTEELLGTCFLTLPSAKAGNKKQRNRIGCLFIKEAGGPPRTSRDALDLLVHFRASLDDLSKQLKKHKLTQELSCPLLNGGIFGIPWGVTAQMMQESGLLFRVYVMKKSRVSEVSTLAGEKQFRQTMAKIAKSMGVDLPYDPKQLLSLDPFRDWYGKEIKIPPKIASAARDELKQFRQGVKDKETGHRKSVVRSTRDSGKSSEQKQETGRRAPTLDRIPRSLTSSGLAPHPRIQLLEGNPNFTLHPVASTMSAKDVDARGVNEALFGLSTGQNFRVPSPEAFRRRKDYDDTPRLRSVRAAKGDKPRRPNVYKIAGVSRFEYIDRYGPKARKDLEAWKAWRARVKQSGEASLDFDPDESDPELAKATKKASDDPSKNKTGKPGLRGGKAPSVDDRNHDSSHKEAPALSSLDDARLERGAEILVSADGLDTKERSLTKGHYNRKRKATNLDHGNGQVDEQKPVPKLQRPRRSTRPRTEQNAID